MKPLPQAWQGHTAGVGAVCPAVQWQSTGQVEQEAAELQQ